jgi:ribose 5-phosphate isomerase
VREEKVKIFEQALA